MNNKIIVNYITRIILHIIKVLHLNKPNFWRYFGIMFLGIVCDMSIFQTSIYIGIDVLYSGLMGGGVSVIIVYTLLQKYFHQMSHSLGSLLVFTIYTSCSITFFSWLIHLIHLMSGIRPILSKISVLPMSFFINYFINHFVLPRIYIKLQKNL